MRLNIWPNRRASITILCLTVLGLTARSAGAQFLQYTPPGGPELRPETRQEQLKRELAAAKYRLGPVHIAPWASLHDLAYVRSLLSSGLRQPNDFTATVGAGFRAYLRNGPKATWTAQVLPEYVWWQRQSQQRQLNGRYLLGFNGYFNHLTVELKAGREQQQQLVTPEVPVPVNSRRDGGELLTELELTGALSAFAAVSFDRQSNLVDDLPDPRTSAIRLLDRDDSVVRGGVRWRPDRQWSVALGAERSETTFAHSALDRSNSGTAPVAEVSFRGHGIAFQVDAADRSQTAAQGAAFVPFHEVTGDASLTLGNAERTSGTLYASRNLLYSLSRDYAYLDDERVGAALNATFGRRTYGRVFVEGGHERYTAFSPSTPPRSDAVSSYGASLTLALRQGFTVGVRGIRSRFDSNLPGADRNYTSVGLTINLTGFQ